MKAEPFLILAKVMTAAAGRDQHSVATFDIS